MAARQEVRPKEHEAAEQRGTASDTRSLNQPVALSTL